jgi:hypothetical protein
MDRLSGALRELARDVVPADPVEPGALWQQGRQRVRRRRAAGAAVVVVAALLAGLAGLLVPQPTVVMPAGPVHEPALPKNVYTPSRWLAGTDDEGPLGRLAVLSSALRGDEGGVFGISATTGEYRFLDLTDRVRNTDVALSSDGRLVAYWITGPTAGTPYPDEPGGQAVGGIAIYDAETGRVRRALFSTDHGLSATAPVWHDERTVAVEERQKTSRTGVARTGTYLWAVGDAAPHRVADVNAEVARRQLNRDGSFLLPTRSGNVFETFALSDGQVVPGPRLELPAQVTPETSAEDTSYLSVSRSGDLVAVVPNAADGYSNPLMVGTVGPDGRVASLELVDKVQAVEFLGWRDDHTALVLGTPAGGPYRLLSADLREKTVHRLGTVGVSASSIGPQVAADLVSAPMVHGLRPPDPVDPRWRVAAVAVLMVIVGAVSAALIRRRRLRAPG